MKDKYIAVKSGALAFVCAFFLKEKHGYRIDTNINFGRLESGFAERAFSTLHVVSNEREKYVSSWGDGVVGAKSGTANTFAEFKAIFEKPEVDLTVKDVALENGLDSRDGIFSSDGKTLTIGCHSTTFDRIERAYKAMKELQK